MSKHKIGDMVRVNFPGVHAHGHECIVLGELELCPGGILGWYLGHRVSFPREIPDEYGALCAFAPDELIPISRLTVDELADAKEVA